MSDSEEAAKERNRQIARNAEEQRLVGGVRVSGAAIFAAIVIGAVLFAIGWIAYRL